MLATGTLKPKTDMRMCVFYTTQDHINDLRPPGERDE
jgi:hypothetical protein